MQPNWLKMLTFESFQRGPITAISAQKTEIFASSASNRTSSWSQLNHTTHSLIEWCPRGDSFSEGDLKSHTNLIQQCGPFDPLSHVLAREGADGLGELVDGTQGHASPAAGPADLGCVPLSE